MNKFTELFLILKTGITNPKNKFYIISGLAVLFTVLVFVHIHKSREGFGTFVRSLHQKNPVNYQTVLLTGSDQEVSSLWSGSIIKYKNKYLNSIVNNKEYTYFFNISLPDARGGDYHTDNTGYDVWAGETKASIFKIGKLVRDGTGEYKLTHITDLQYKFFQITITDTSGKIHKILSGKTN